MTLCECGKLSYWLNFRGFLSYLTDRYKCDSFYATIFLIMLIAQEIFVSVSSSKFSVPVMTMDSRDTG